MVFKKSLESDHIKAVDDERKISIEVIFYFEEKYLIFTKSDGSNIKLPLNTDGGDNTILLPKDGDSLRPIIKEAMEELGYREPFFIDTD